MIGLTQLNVWIDVVFTTLYVVIVVALSGHFFGNILTGRAKRRFVGWEWPAHEGGPIPALPKFLHFQHVAAMIALGISGMYIRFPFFNGGRAFMQWVHYIAMIIVIVNLIVRLWYAFGSRRRDYREFSISKRDLTTAPQVILYYIFVKPSKPHLGKYNIMQKGTYTLFVPLLIAQAITGLMLWRLMLPIVDVSLQQLVAGLIGASGVWWIRTAHYLINWLFIVLTTIHVYLSVTEDLPAFLDFFGLGFLDRPHAEHGDHGDAHSDKHAHDGAASGVEHAPAVPLVDQV